MIEPRVTAVAVFRRDRQEPWKSRPVGTRFIKFDDRRATGIALVLGFMLGAAVVALRGAARRLARQWE
jgi:hypothetical protein